MRMPLLARLAAAWRRRQDRRRQQRLLARLGISRATDVQTPRPRTDADASRAARHCLASAAARGESPDLSEVLRRTGVAVCEAEGLAAAIGTDVRLTRFPDGSLTLLLDASISGFVARVAMAWALDRRLHGPRSETADVLDVRLLARAVLDVPHHPLRPFLLPPGALAQARRPHGDDREALARRLRVPPALLVRTQA
jgi:hypothetical protein